jgi:hypothetical protein
LKAVNIGVIIEDYPEDKPCPSALIFGMCAGTPLHVVVAYDEKSDWAYIITAYEPGPEAFDPDFMRRRK